MSPVRTLQTAISSLGANRLRAGLALLGIVIGVTAVISLMSIGRGAQAFITGRIESLGTNLLFVQPGSSSQGGVTGSMGSAGTLTLEDAIALVDPIYAPSIVAVAPEIRTSAQMIAGKKNERPQIVGVTPDYLSVRNLEMESGMAISWPHVDNRDEVTVLGAQLSENLFGFRDPVGQTVRIRGRMFTVIGTLKFRGGSSWGSFDNQALIPISTAHFRLSNQRTPSGDVTAQLINVKARDADQTDVTLMEISTVLRMRHRIGEDDEDDFRITNQQSVLETLEETTNTFVVFLGAIAGISLLVGGIGIMNIMLVSVTERTREIGIRKAMGAKRRDILFQFVTEATLLSLGGGSAGVLLGVAVSRFLNGQSLGTQTFRTVFSGDIALLALFVSAGIGLFFGIYPAVRAARLHPIDALRYE